MLNPSGLHASAQAGRRDYQRVLSRQASLGDAELEAEYQALVADDGITVPMGLRRLAFNDVLDEMGLDASARYPAGSLWLFAVLT